MYALYAQQFGLLLTLFFFAALLGATGSLEMASSLWLASWTADGVNATIPVEQRVLVYGILGVSKC